MHIIFVFVFCIKVHIIPDTTPVPEYTAVDPSAEPCRCLCGDDGKAVIQPTCADVINPFRPISTLPPAEEGECPCMVPPHSGRCSFGYFYNAGWCYGSLFSLLWWISTFASKWISSFHFFEIWIINRRNYLFLILWRLTLLLQMKF